VQSSAESARRAHLFAALAMLAFAGNSLLCRHALRPASIDPLHFAFLRVSAGAALLLLLSLSQPRVRTVRQCGSWCSALALSGYAIAFSLAYVALDAATGTLILFAAVQSTMIGWAIARGERPTARVWTGFGCANAGLAVLLLPGVSAPDPVGTAWMAIAGVSWGIYSLRGRGQQDPISTTAANFLRAIPVCAVAAFAVAPEPADGITIQGFGLAVTSGAITSGLGYVLWYAALARIKATTAAMVQMTVPVLAAAGGVLWFDERPTIRLGASALLVLFGTRLVVTAHDR
jgi:drug/metabolite transporter (DMT)-like permease